MSQPTTSQTANSQPATPGQPDIETALRQLNCQVAALTTAAAGIRAGTARLSNLNAETGRALEIVNGRILRAVGFRGPEVSVAIPAEAAASRGVGSLPANSQPDSRLPSPRNYDACLLSRTSLRGAL